MPYPHCKNLRKGRYSQSGGIYLPAFATTRPWFSDWGLGRLVVAALRQAQALKQAESLAFVAMPDHAHWLTQIGNIHLAELT